VATTADAAAAASSHRDVAAAPTRAAKAPTSASMAADLPPASTRAPSYDHVGSA